MGLLRRHHSDGAEPLPPLDVAIYTSDGVKHSALDVTYVGQQKLETSAGKVRHDVWQATFPRAVFEEWNEGTCALSMKIPERTALQIAPHDT